ncbi:MAG: MurR/RpiR family transcriptional regulator [Limnochordales bacterium]|nr:MurR/RpiR family transcriptional regulator [Limnochordales bacterium]
MGLAEIRSMYPSLAPSEQRVADYVLQHPEEVIYASVTQLAEACGVGESTVIRFCQSVGFRGYQELKLALALQHRDPPREIQGDVQPGDGLPVMVEKVTYANLEIIRDTARMVDYQALEKAIDTLVGARRVEFYGVGASGVTALDAKYKFLRVGFTCDAYVDSHLQAMSAATLGPGDVAVGITHSGSTKDVVDSCRIAREAGATVIAITDYKRAPIVEVADITLLTACREGPLGSGALRSKIAQIHLLDLLWTGVVLRLGDRALTYTEKTAHAVVDKLY